MSHSIKVDILNDREKNIIANDMHDLMSDKHIRRKVVLRKITGRTLDVTTGLYTDTWTNTATYAMKGIYPSTEMPTGKGMGIMQWGDLYFLIPTRDITSIGLDKDDRILELRYNSGSVSVTKGNTSVTGDGTEWSTRIGKGDWFKLETEPLSYLNEIYTVGSDTTLTLTTAYAGETKENFSYEVYKEYHVVGVEEDTFTGIIRKYWCREVK